MPRFPSGLILLSAVIAVLLWLFATALENYLQPGDSAPVERDTADRAPEPSGSGVVEPGSMSCEQAELVLSELVNESRFCLTDDDCTLFDYGYPIDCMTAVAKSQIPALRQEYKRYDQSCRHRVYFDCPTEPFVRLAQCHDNQCMVELATSDALRNRTLDLLRKRDD